MAREQESPAYKITIIITNRHINRSLGLSLTNQTKEQNKAWKKILLEEVKRNIEQLEAWENKIMEMK